MRILITESQLKLINEELVNTTPSKVLNDNLSSLPTLIPLYQEIEKTLNDKFTQDHFNEEKKYSLGLKKVGSGLSPDAVTAFKNMIKKYNLVGKVKIKDNSFRDYTKQKDTFIEMARKNGGINGKIKHGLRQAALPGFSQHHTGKAFDISSSNLVADDMLRAFNFKRPYPTPTPFRMAEPWHIFYTK